MLSHLDFIIFPDRCEVLEIIPSQRYFYPIYKNASSSINEEAKKNKWRVYLNEQIKRLPSVDVIIRDPEERFVSGVSSFVTQILKENPTLDKNTVLWFVKNYLHLNRHYCMQFSWLLNLARYLHPDVKINLLGMDAVKQITSLESNPWGVKDKFDIQPKNLPSQEMYQRIDQILFNAIGQSLTFAEIIQLIKDQDADAYKQVIQRSQRILNPTYVVPKT